MAHTDTHCFVCHIRITDPHNASSIDHAEDTAADYPIITKHSKRSVFDLLEQFLGFSLQEERCESNRWCDGCLERIDDYDLAIQRANQRENELIELFMNAVKAEEEAPEEETLCEEDIIDEPEPKEEQHDEIDDVVATVLILPATDEDDLLVAEDVDVDYDVDYTTEVYLSEEEDDIKLSPDDDLQQQTLTSAAVTDETLFKCTRCEQFFVSNQSYKVHIKACKSSRKTFNCKECGHISRTKAALKIHVALHSGITPYECDVCGKQFTQRGALLRHMPLHTGEKPYQCERCGKQFIHYSSFHMHKLAHDDIRDKQCTICGMELRSNSHLSRHMRVHSGEKPHACPTCGQKFAQRYNMMTHYKTHQGIHRASGKTRKCSFCEQRFGKLSLLREHMAKEHSGAVKEEAEATTNLIVSAASDEERLDLQDHDDLLFEGEEYIIS